MPEKAEETDNCGVNTPAHTQKINKPQKISENSKTNKNETIENDKNHDHDECTANIFQVDLCKRGTAKPRSLPESMRKINEETDHCLKEQLAKKSSNPYKLLPKPVQHV